MNYVLKKIKNMEDRKMKQLNTQEIKGIKKRLLPVHSADVYNALDA